MEGFSICPVYWEVNGWYFWNETWSDSYGPYGSYAKAHSALRRYCWLYL